MLSAITYSYMTWKSHLGFQKCPWKGCKSLVLRFKSFSPNIQRGITKQTQGNVVYCLTAKKKQTNKQTKKTKKRTKKFGISTYSTYGSCTRIFVIIYMVVRERISYRITTVSLTKHVQRNICHLSNPIKVGWFAREGHPLHSLCDWTCYNWIITNNPSLISVDCIFGGGVGICSTSDAEGLVHNDRIVAGVSLQQCVVRTMV